MAFGTGVSNLLATTATVGMLVRSCSKFSQAQLVGTGGELRFYSKFITIFKKYYTF